MGKSAKENKLTEMALLDEQGISRTLLELSPDPIVVLQDDCYKYVSPAFTDLFGYTEQEVYDGLSFFELVQEQDQKAVRRRYEKRLKGIKVSKTYRINFITKAGKVVPCETSAKLVHHKGRPADLVFMRDITERVQKEEALRTAHDKLEKRVQQRTSDLLEANKQLAQVIKNCIRTEESLRTSKEMFEKTFTSQLDALFILDLSNPPKILNCNPSAARVFGYRRQELIDQTTGLLHVDTAALRRFQDHLHSAIAGSGFLRLFEFDMKRKDGAVFPTEQTVVLLEDDQGKQIGWMSVIRDITRRKQAAEALRKSEAELLEKSIHLEEVNAALKALLERREEDRLDLEESLLTNAKGLKQED